jgi:Domain of unknown function (DUF4349)
VIGRRVMWWIMATAVAGLLAGCGSGAERSSGVQGAAAPEAKVPAPAQGGAGQDGSGQVKQQDGPGPVAADSGQRAQVSQPGVDRKLVRTASLELAAPNVVEIAGRARDIAVRLGGFAGQEEVKGDSAMITLHIPSNEFDRALGELSGLVPAENLKSRNTTAEDVTEQVVDLDSRIATQRASVDRVRALLARAGTVNEIVQIESEVTRREADLESLEKRREALSGQVALSRVTVRVARDGVAPPPPATDDGFLAGLAAGWDAFVGALRVLLLVLGALLPFLIVIGVPGVIALRWWRRRRTAAVTPAGQQA